MSIMQQRYELYLLDEASVNWVVVQTFDAGHEHVRGSIQHGHHLSFLCVNENAGMLHPGARHLMQCSSVDIPQHRFFPPPPALQYQRDGGKIHPDAGAPRRVTKVTEKQNYRAIPCEPTVAAAGKILIGKSVKGAIRKRGVMTGNDA